MRVQAFSLSVFPKGQRMGTYIMSAHPTALTLLTIQLPTEIHLLGQYEQVLVRNYTGKGIIIICNPTAL